jgi:CubicO group peptidase (beta-lactamase class C family)
MRVQPHECLASFRLTPVCLAPACLSPVRLVAVCLITLGLLPHINAVYSQESQTNQDEAVGRALEKLRSIDATGLPGISVLVSRDGNVLVEESIGLADLENQIPITGKTKFRIGSVTKQFTAAAVLKLVEDGKLRLEDTLDRFLPDFARGDEVTIHHLLSHTSGIPSFTDDPNFFATVTEPTTEEELIATFAGKEFSSAPGSQFHYNNSGYFLLGHIVRKVTDKSIGDYWKENFFGPLDMNDTGFHQPGLNIDQEAKGYSFDGDKAVAALDWNMSRAGGAGAIYSTIGDLFKWNEAVFSGKVISDESLSKALTVSEQSKDSMNYGYGWTIQTDRGLKQVSHNGGLQGFQSVLIRYPDQNMNIVALHNSGPPVPAMNPARIAAELAECFLADEMVPAEIRQVDESVDPAIFDSYVGRYDYGSAVMTITRKGDSLMTQITGQPEFELYPESETRFFLKVVDAQVEFVMDDDGKCVAVMHTQGPLRFRAAKLATVEPIELSETELDRFVGVYDYKLAKMRITRDDMQLMAQLDGQPKFPIYAVSDNTFEWKVVNAKIEFITEDEKVVAAKHTQSGVTFRAEKIE